MKIWQTPGLRLKLVFPLSPLAGSLNRTPPHPPDPPDPSYSSDFPPLSSSSSMPRRKFSSIRSSLTSTTPTVATAVTDVAEVAPSDPLAVTTFASSSLDSSPDLINSVSHLLASYLNTGSSKNSQRFTTFSTGSGSPTVDTVKSVTVDTTVNPKSLSPSSIPTINPPLRPKSGILGASPPCSLPKPKPTLRSDL